MAKTTSDHSQQALAIDPVPPTGRRRARAAEHPPRRLSPPAGDAASGTRPRPPFECIALLLQGGGALGAYQAGVYEALTEADLHPDWIAGVSIGAINAALIAGNAPEARVDKLRAFWERVTAKHNGGWSERLFLAKGDAARRWQNQISANLALVSGVPGFFAPRFPAPWLHTPGTMEATSFYDTSRLRLTFDTTTHTIGPEHIMASAALPPAFPAVEIEGEHYWDGGLVSNTPLQWIIDSHPHRDTLAFQVDLWNACGEPPRTIAEVSTRQKEIQYSSRTRAGTDNFKYVQRLRRALADLFKKLPEDLQNSPEAQLLQAEGDHKAYNIVHLIYRAMNYEGHSKDYEFSRASMREHWRAGYHDAVRTLRHPEVLERPANHEGVFAFDLADDRRE